MKKVRSFFFFIGSRMRQLSVHTYEPQICPFTWIARRRNRVFCPQSTCIYHTEHSGNFPGNEVAEPEGDDSFPACAERSTAWRYASIPPTYLYVYCLIKICDNFTFRWPLLAPKRLFFFYQEMPSTKTAHANCPSMKYKTNCRFGISISLCKWET